MSDEFKISDLVNYSPDGTMYSQGNMSNARELIRTTKDIRDLLMRTNFVDLNEARDAAMFLCWCKEFNVPLDLIEALLAARPSVGGLARREYAQTSVGVLSPELWELKRRRGLAQMLGSKGGGDNSNHSGGDL